MTTCVVILLCAGSAVAQTRPDTDPSAPSVTQLSESDPMRFVRWTVQDPADWIRTSSWKRAGRFGLSLAVLVPMSRLDERLLSGREKAEGRYGEILEIANEFGGPNAIWFPVTIFGASLFTTDTKFQDAAFTSMQSPVYAYFLTALSKRAIVGRRRPYEEMGAYEFEFLSNRNSSFPSGHATTAWAIVTPWMVYYDGPASKVLGVFAAGTAISRMQRQQHWLTDVVAGSALGFATGYWLAKRHMGEAGLLDIQAGPGSASVSLRF